MMKCKNCSAEVKQDWKLCPRCGVPLDINTDGASPSINSAVTINAPSPWLYGIGILIIVIASLVSIALFFVLLFSFSPDTRFTVPGSRELEFDSAGSYNIFYEHQSTIDGMFYATGLSLKEMEIALISDDENKEIPLNNPLWNFSYEIGSRAGKLLFYFDIKKPGTYMLTAEYTDGTTTPKAVFAIGPAWDIYGLMLRSLGIVYGGMILGGSAILLVFHRRRWAADLVSKPVNQTISRRSRITVSMLALFLGWLGIHRFYLEKYVTGALMFLTFGGLFIWQLIDFIIAVSGNMKDKDNLLITKW